jgi:hypothetical protein
MQKRFIGYADDVTQENCLFMVKANSLPGIKYGLQTDLNPDTLILTMQPGYMILPDGMIIGETEALPIQLVEPGNGDYWATLIASRLIAPGMLNNTVTYSIIPNRLAADVLSNVPNYIRMPLTWIQKYQGNFYLTDLGNRYTKFQIQKILTPPFPEIYTPAPQMYFVNNILSRGFNELDDTFYLRIPREFDTYISNILITAFGDVNVNLNATITSINSSAVLNFTAESSTLMVEYPVASYILEDVLQFNVPGNNNLYISEISIIRTRLF